MRAAAHEEDARLARERTEAERRQAEEEARKQSEDQARRRAEDEARRRLGEEAVPRRAPMARRPETTDAAAPGPCGFALPEADRGAEADPHQGSAGGDRQRGRLTVTNALETAESERERSLASVRRKREKQQRQLHGFKPTQEKIVRDVVIPEAITVQELANRMAERAVDVIRLLMKDGQMVKITDVLDPDTAQIVAEELGHNVRRVAAADVEEGLFDAPDADGDAAAAPARRHHHGPCRPRQDVAARRHPRRQCRRRPRPAASPSTSAPTRSSRTARRSPSSTRPATRPSPPCAPAARRRPTSPSWWWRPMTA